MADQDRDSEAFEWAREWFARNELIKADIALGAIKHPENIPGYHDLRTSLTRHLDIQWLRGAEALLKIYDFVHAKDCLDQMFDQNTESCSTLRKTVAKYLHLQQQVNKLNCNLDHPK